MPEVEKCTLFTTQEGKINEMYWNDCRRNVREVWNESDLLWHECRWLRRSPYYNMCLIRLNLFWSLCFINILNQIIGMWWTWKTSSQSSLWRNMIMQHASTEPGVIGLQGVCNMPSKHGSNNNYFLLIQFYLDHQCPLSTVPMSGCANAMSFVVGALAKVAVDLVNHSSFVTKIYIQIHER